MDHSTIAAIATPEGFGGIGIIKISGPEALSVIRAVFTPCGNGSGPARPDGAGGEFPLQSWRLYYGNICDPDSSRMVDEVLVAVMRAPYSYTREDVVEIQAHAGPKILHTILDLLISRGIRLAEPGEFTRRAFLNGRIDLTQAEAVIDLINAKSDAAIDMVMSQMSGGFKSVIENIRGTILGVLSQIEVGIDFPDAVEDDINTAELGCRLFESARLPVSDLIDAYEKDHVLRDGLRVVIVGGPNVGKSSLLNCLIQQNRAIVTDIPGTTRDFIESSMVAHGIPIVLADTAGLRIDPDPVERLGIEKTREYIKSADILLFTVDVGEALQKEHLELVEELSVKPVLLVLNKTDLSESMRRFKLPEQWQAMPKAEVSALNGTGISALKKSIANMALKSAGKSPHHSLVPNTRQRESLACALRSIDEAHRGLKESALPELVAVDLREALSALGEITGSQIGEEVLDGIFSRYCIGK